MSSNGPSSSTTLPTLLLMLFYPVPQGRGYRIVPHNSTAILSCAFWTALLGVHKAAQFCKSMEMDNIQATCFHVPCQLPIIDGFLFRWGTPPYLAQGYTEAHFHLGCLHGGPWGPFRMLGCLQQAASRLLKVVASFVGHKVRVGGHL